MSSPTTPEHPRLRRDLPRRPGLLLVGTLALAAATGACAEDAPGDSAPTSAVTATTPDLADTAAETPEPDAGDDVDDAVAAVEDVPTEIAATTTELDEDELAGLLWMREEEQLARDVYTALGEEWDLRIFDNIAASEQHHLDETVAVLAEYGLDDPFADNPAGTFTDPTLQALHDDLVAEGRASVEDALAVGALVEELDIADLRARAARTDEPSLADLYARLEQGSRNHLRAFVSQLHVRGITYEPTQLDQADFEAIVTSERERGQGAGQGAGGSGGRHGGGNGDGHRGGRG